MSLTIFSTPRPFVGMVGMNQRNAITSWQQIGLNVILFGTDESAGALCDNTLNPTEGSTYHAGDLFNRAQELSSDPVLCYCNADIILTSGFETAVNNVARVLSKFVAVGRRTDLDVTQPIEFCDTWESEILARARQEGRPHDVCGMDYIVFTRPLKVNWQPVLVGRPAWDVWLLRYVLDARIPLVDMTNDVTAIHCNHGARQYENGPNANPLAIAEARHNQAITAHTKHAYISHANYELTNGRLARYEYVSSQIIDERAIVDERDPLGCNNVHSTREGRQRARIQRGR